MTVTYDPALIIFSSTALMRKGLSPLELAVVDGLLYLERLADKVTRTIQFFAGMQMHMSTLKDTTPIELISAGMQALFALITLYLSPDYSYMYDAMRKDCPVLVWSIAACILCIAHLWAIGSGRWDRRATVLAASAVWWFWVCVAATRVGPTLIHLMIILCFACLCGMRSLSHSHAGGTKHELGGRTE